MVPGLYFKDSQNETRIADSDAVALRFLALLPKLNSRLFCSHLFSSAVQLIISMIGTELPSPATSIRKRLPSRVTS
jgi:hypothetical protein